MENHKEKLVLEKNFVQLVIAPLHNVPARWLHEREIKNDRTSLLIFNLIKKKNFKKPEIR